MRSSPQRRRAFPSTRAPDWTWDYRYCWLRDAYFTLNALERLGHSEEMERFLEYLRNLAERSEGTLPARRTGSAAGRMRPSESSSTSPASRAKKPVRVGNQAFEHVQNDVIGEMVLAVSRLFLDMRFVGSVPPKTALDTVGGLARRRSRARLEEADAGPWEFRERWRLHGFTVLMPCTAAAQRAVEVGRGARPTPSSRYRARGRWRPGRPCSSRRAAGTTRSAP